MHEQPTPTPSEDNRITRALPYVVGLVVALGLFAYNLRGDGGEERSPVTVAAEAAGPDEILGAARDALDGPAFADVDVVGQDGRIVLSGLVPDEAARAAAEAAVAAVDGVETIDNRLRVGRTGADAAAAESTVVTVTSAADAGGSGTTVAPATTAVPGTTAAEPPAATAAPTTSAAAAPTTLVVVIPAPTTTTPAPATTEVPTVATAAATGEPVPTPAELDAALADLLQAEPIQFGLLSSEVGDPSLDTLERAAALLLSSPGTRFEVQGHTDSGGQPAFNRDLSERRADAVRLLLIGFSVPAEQLTAVGYGEDRPVARNATPEGRALNRRVEIVVVP